MTTVNHGFEDVDFAVALGWKLGTACSSWYVDANSTSLVLQPNPFVSVGPCGGGKILAHDFVRNCAVVVADGSSTRALAHDPIL